LRGQVYVRLGLVKEEKMASRLKERLESYYYRGKAPYGKAGTRERDAYRDEQGLLHQEFQEDLFEHYGVTDNPKARKAFQLAWDYGHADGHAEVDIYFSDLVELIK